MVEESDLEQIEQVDNNYTQEELFPVASIEVNSNGFIINTGNNYLDTGIFISIALIVVFFIYGKYFKRTGN